MKKILIVDDDAAISESIEDILKQESFEVDIIDHLDGAVAFIKNIKPDLVLLDVMFPGNPSGGFDLARDIRKDSELGDLPVMFITSVNKEFPMDFSIKDIGNEWFPAQDFIEKPIDFNELVKKIKNLI